MLLWQVACEFIAASRKLGPQGFASATAWERLGEFLDLFPLILPTQDVFDRARQLHLEQQVAYWDAMLISACLPVGVTRLYSEDPPSRNRIDTLEIINPFS